MSGAGDSGDIEVSTWLRNWILWLIIVFPCFSTYWGIPKPHLFGTVTPYIEVDDGFFIGVWKPCPCWFDFLLCFGSADSYHWITDPDPYPTLFFSILFSSFRFFSILTVLTGLRYIRIGYFGLQRICWAVSKCVLFAFPGRSNRVCKQKVYHISRASLLTA